MVQSIFKIVTISIAFSSLVNAQFEGTQLNTPEALPSYTLYQNFNLTYVVDNCGGIVAEWPNIENSRFHPKLLPNGNIIHITGNQIVEHDWEGNRLRSTSVEADLELIYEVILLPNGNYLSAARRVVSGDFFTDLGYSEAAELFTWNDAVVEINPEDGSIVWEWRISDHIIQQRDQNLPNYGILEENPQLLNVDAISAFDWTTRESFMINGMDYNPELDQIALSVRKMSEVIIIDHSTTAEEARGHTGGKSGMGGDILYRWGNPQNYNQGGPEDRILFFQHNPNWIEHGEHKGSLVMYNNGLNRPNTNFQTQFSTVEIVNTGVNVDGRYTKLEDEPFGPSIPTFTLSGEVDKNDFYSGYTCGAEVLPNGNIFITIGRNLREFTMDGQQVWVYQIPFGGPFRTEKYPLDYPAFQNRDLTPDGTVEERPSIFDCELSETVSIDNLNATSLQGITVTQSDGIVTLAHEREKFSYAIFNSNAQLIKKNGTAENHHIIHTGLYQTGLYIIQIKSDSGTESLKIFIK